VGDGPTIHDDLEDMAQALAGEPHSHRLGIEGQVSGVGWVPRDCATCDGTGKKNDVPCSECQGTGVAHDQ
jgi:DnaJ-class molecular chaperone